MYMFRYHCSKEKFLENPAYTCFRYHCSRERFLENPACTCFRYHCSREKFLQNPACFRYHCSKEKFCENPACTCFRHHCSKERFLSKRRQKHRFRMLVSVRFIFLDVFGFTESGGVNREPVVWVVTQSMQSVWLMKL